MHLDEKPNKLKREDMRPQKITPTISRIYYFLEIAIVMILNTVLLILMQLLLPYDRDNLNYVQSLIANYVFPLISLLIGTVLGLIIVKKLVVESERIPNLDGTSPISEVFSTFKITKKNFKYQLMYAMLILFLIYVPIDFLANIIPGILEFTSEAFSESTTHGFLNQNNFTIFITFAFAVYFVSSFREELFYRALAILRGRRHVGLYSSIMITSFSFALSHFIYIITNETTMQAPLGAIIWGATAFLTGSISALFMGKKRYIWPLIIAHALNNVISATSVWLYNNNGASYTEFSQIGVFWDIAIPLYVPLLLVSIILFIVFRKHTKSGIKQYFEIGAKYGQELGDSKVKLVIFDVILSILIFITSLLMF